MYDRAPDTSQTGKVSKRPRHYHTLHTNVFMYLALEFFFSLQNHKHGIYVPLTVAMLVPRSFLDIKFIERNVDYLMSLLCGTQP